MPDEVTSGLSLVHNAGIAQRLSLRGPVIESTRPRCTLVTLVVALMIAQAAAVGCATAGASAAGRTGPTRVVDVAALPQLDELVGRLTDLEVIFVGERHDRYEDHLAQLAVLEGLQQRGESLAIGMEAFQQPLQTHLDAYVAGAISEEEMLRRTEYFSRWRFDYRLYRPILRFARQHGIPVIALNLPNELTEKVGDVGIAGLSKEERAQLPEGIDRGDPAYRARLKRAFEAHPGMDEKDFEHFLEVQLLWDEGMAARAAQFLAEHPERTLVVLAGVGHVEYGQGIPARLGSRRPSKSAILINGRGRNFDLELADFLLFPEPVELSKAGLLGVMIDGQSGGPGVVVEGFAEVSGAKDAGIEEQDRIVRLGDTPVDEYADLRIALIDRGAGTMVPVEVLRDRIIGESERLRFKVRLH